jgi:hypothetical protein
MKNSGIKYLMAALIPVLFSCQKSNMQGNQTVTLHVSEFKTNHPIEGATVSLYDKGTFDFLTCGCYESHLLLQGQTDNNGNFTVRQDVLNKVTMGISVVKEPYLAAGGDNSTTQFIMSAVETIQLRLVKVNPYPGLSHIILAYCGETDQTMPVQGLFNFSQGITDTTLTVFAYGEQTNTFNIKIIDSSNNTIANPGPFLINVSRTDISNVKEIDY